MKRFLFYDSDSSGHHPEYFANIIYALQGQREVHGFVLCAPELEEQLSAFARQHGSPVTVQAINQVLFSKIENAKRYWERGRHEASCFVHYASQLHPDLAISLYFNPMHLFLGSRRNRKRLRCPVRGILLNPFPLPSRLRGAKSQLIGWFKASRKLLQFRLMARNRWLDRVFVLNDQPMAEFLNRALGRMHLFEGLPDPLPWFAVGKVSPKLSRRSSRYRFLLPGSLEPRKGCVEALRALLLLPDERLSSLELRIVGRFRKQAYRDRVTPLIDELKRRSADQTVDLLEARLSNEDLLLEFANCDAVLIPYCGFHGSSGVLGHAVNSGKPVLATNEGLIGELVEKHCLGQTANPRDAIALGDKMRVMSQQRFQLGVRAETYLRYCTIENFFRLLVD